jgi:hypothetical protein
MRPSTVNGSSRAATEPVRHTSSSSRHPDVNELSPWHPAARRSAITIAVIAWSPVNSRAAWYEAIHTPSPLAAGCRLNRALARTSSSIVRVMDSSLISITGKPVSQRGAREPRTGAVVFRQRPTHRDPLGAPVVGGPAALAASLVILEKRRSSGSGASILPILALSQQPGLPCSRVTCACGCLVFPVTLRHRAQSGTQPVHYLICRSLLTRLIDYCSYINIYIKRAKSHDRSLGTQAHAETMLKSSRKELLRGAHESLRYIPEGSAYLQV